MLDITRAKGITSKCPAPPTRSYRRTFNFAMACMLPCVAIAQKAPEPLPKEEVRLLAATYHLLRESFVKPLSGEEILQAALRGMVKELDPEGGQFVMKEDLADMQDPPSYNDGAVGLEMSKRNGEVVVISPIEGGPADRAGIRPNDVVYAVDGTPSNGNLAKTVKMLRGQLDSTVIVSMRRPGEAETREFKIERKIVQAATVRVSAIAPDVAVLRVTAFRADTLSQIADGLVAQWGRQRFKGVVLDLRRNPGGLMDVSIGLASLFLPAKSLVADVRERTPQTSKVYFAQPEYYTKGADPLAVVPQHVRDLPLVVLVDEGTASGAEIVAAALRDHKRARIVGRKTFGRTSIQTYRPFGTDYGIKFTTAYWYPPSLEKLDKVGVLPDRIVERPDFPHEMEVAVSELRRGMQ